MLANQMPLWPFHLGLIRRFLVCQLHSPLHACQMSTIPLHTLKEIWRRWNSRLVIVSRISHELRPTDATPIATTSSNPWKGFSSLQRIVYQHLVID